MLELDTTVDVPAELSRRLPSQSNVGAFARVIDTIRPRRRIDHEGVSQAVYLAKTPGGTWRSRSLRQLVEHARSSYKVHYGPQVVTFDEYDEKAWVYIAVSSYESSGRKFDEVLTLRFVPAAGSPARNEDLDFYVHKASPQRDLVDMLGETIASVDAAGTLRGCYSQSRMGAIRPWARDGATLPGNRHVGLAWRSMLECFLEDTARAGRRCLLLTSQTTEQLQVLGASIPTRRCHEVLGLAPDAIVLNRQAPHVRELCYQVPTYFLNMRDVGRLFARLQREGLVNPMALQNATTGGVTLDRALKHPQASTFKRLALLFSHRGVIPGSRLTGEELRVLADEEVRDGPVLRLTHVEQLGTARNELGRSEFDGTRLAAPRTTVDAVL